jgi:hypothetical protein
MKLLTIEEDLITLLTKIAWWIDLRFNKGSVWVSLLLLVFTSTVVNVLFAVDSYNDTINNFSNFVTWFVMIIFIPSLITSVYAVGTWAIWVGSFMFIDQSFRIFKNTKLSPNPNKYTWWLWICRVQVVTPFILGITEQSMFLTVCGVTLIFVPSFYILCVDALLPGLKKKLLEDSKNKRLQFVPQKN